MLRSTIILFALASLTVGVVAAPKTLKVTNRSGKQLSAITAKLQNSSTNVPVTFAAAIPANTSATVTFNLPDPTCIVDLIVVLTPSSNRTILGFDACNVDGVLIE